MSAKKRKVRVDTAAGTTNNTAGPAQEEAVVDILKPLPSIVLPTLCAVDNSDPFGYRFARRLLKEGGMDEAQIQASIDQKLVGKHLMLENPPKGEGDAKPKRVNFQPVRLTSKLRRQLGFMDGTSGLAAQNLVYEHFLPLHELWTQYISGSESSQTLKMAKADYHGAIIRVFASKNPGLVGIEGIVLQETTHTFRIITKENKTKMIPKKSSLFDIPVGKKKTFRINGNHIQLRASERSVRKYKSKATMEL